MAALVRIETRETSLPDGNVCVLECEGERAEIWPHQGFNCYRWVSRGQEILYADPDFFKGSSPTRGGIPILFPFPNRIRDGRFTWNGKDYQLPLNDPAKKNAIHGFACRRAWRIVDRGSDDRSVWVTGEFHGAQDAADSVELWPADYRIRVTYRLADRHLRIAARIDAVAGELPFGLGYHHYFQVEPNAMIAVPGRKFWELEENLPTGRTLDLFGSRDLRVRRRFADLHLDDVLTDLDMCQRGEIRRGGINVQMWTTPAFRELVVFTPPHRQAFCIEPYTCTTDAINLQARGIDSGWRVLQAGAHWDGVVEMTVHQQ